jgi:uncharacterized damage-inducible protein DinB
MQATEVTKIRNRVTAARAKLLAAVEGLDDAAWEWQPGDGRWSIRLTLAHVGSSQWDHLRIARRLLAGESIDISDFDLDAWNATKVAERGDWRLPRVLADLEAGHQEALAFLDSLDPAQLSARGIHPALGEVTVSQVLRVLAMHDGLHRRDIVQLRQEMARR